MTHRYWDSERQRWVYPTPLHETDTIRARIARAGMAVDHIDGDPTNNDLENIRLVPIKARGPK